MADTPIIKLCFGHALQQRILVEAFAAPAQAKPRTRHRQGGRKSPGC